MLGGTPVTITGTNFPPQRANSTLAIVARPKVVPLTQVTVVNGTTMTAVTGPHAAGGPFNLHLGFVTDSNASGFMFTYTTILRRAFTYAGATLTSISPNSGSVLGGTPVTITGTNFPPQSANPTLTIANVPLTQVTVVNGTTMTAVTGPHALGGPFGLDLVVVSVPESSGPNSAGPSPTRVRPSPASARIPGPCWAARR